MNWLKKYYWELIVVGVVAVVLFQAMPNGWTWTNTDSDGAHYTLAAKYMSTAHHMSAPLYLLLGRLFLYIPIGSEAWRMGLMSVLGTIGSCIFIYLILRHLLKDNPKARFYALVSVLVYGGSALVISQATIIETYSLSTMCGVGAYYFALKQKWTLASVILGAGLAIHPFLAFIVWAVMFVAFKEMRNWKRYLVTIAFFSFYLYIPIVKFLGNDLGMWGNTTGKGFFEGTAGMVLMLTGGLSIWDFPQRVINTVLILGASLGLAIVPLTWFFVKKRTWKYHLLWVFLIPVLYFATDLANETYVYLLPSIAFGSIVVGMALSKMGKRWALGTCAVAVVLMGFNAWYFNIPKHLDPDMSAMKFYRDLGKIPDGQYLMGSGWTWAMVYVYNKEEGRNIIPISQDAIVSDEYLAILDGMKVKYQKSEAESYITKEGETALSIAKLNEGVWIAKETKPEVYQYEIVPAKGNEGYVGRWIGQEVQPEWKWKPSNPWDFIAGRLEVKEWHHVLWSNRNMLHVIVYGMLGYGAVWWYRDYRKKRALQAVSKSKEVRG